MCMYLALWKLIMESKTSILQEFSVKTQARNDSFTHMKGTVPHLIWYTFLLSHSICCHSAQLLLINMIGWHVCGYCSCDCHNDDNITQETKNWPEAACWVALHQGVCECVCVCVRVRRECMSAAGHRSWAQSRAVLHHQSFVKGSFCSLSPQHRLSARMTDGNHGRTGPPLRSTSARFVWSLMTLLWHHSQFRFIVLSVVSVKGIVWPK